VYSLWLTPAASAKRRHFEAPMTPNVCRSSAELRPNSLPLPSRIEPNIRPNPLAELRRLPNFGPSLLGNKELPEKKLEKSSVRQISEFFEPPISDI